MSKIIDISNLYPARPNGLPSLNRARLHPADRELSLVPFEPTIDRVDLSDEGIRLSRATSEQDARIARRAQIVADIAAGTYITPDKIDVTVDRLLDILA
ncbi:MAG: hypothetical protein JSV78_14835 [Phycisphaerales bacterium]|nr:MAG: hypothetical protein JSV78_14835 [Phycisphaerales bacterium]